MAHTPFVKLFKRNRCHTGLLVALDFTTAHKNQPLNMNYIYNNSCQTTALLPGFTFAYGIGRRLECCLAMDLTIHVPFWRLSTIATSFCILHFVRPTFKMQGELPPLLHHCDLKRLETKENNFAVHSKKIQGFIFPLLFPSSTFNVRDVDVVVLKIVVFSENAPFPMLRQTKTCTALKQN